MGHEIAAALTGSATPPPAAEATITAAPAPRTAVGPGCLRRSASRLTASRMRRSLVPPAVRGSIRLCGCDDRVAITAVPTQLVQSIIEILALVLRH